MKKIYLTILFLFFTLFLILIYFFKKDLGMASVALSGKEKSISYLVEIADTPQKAKIGLMYRKFMPQNHGMLFIFQPPKIVHMWMKNTYIPLDMVFFNAQGQIICLYENAKPLDESIITCPYPASKVLELNAGEIKAQNIQLGDTLFIK